MNANLIPSIVGNCPHCGKLNGLCSPHSGEWRESRIENHHCACWWAGQQDGIYHLQFSRALTDEEILALSTPQEMDASEAFIISRAATIGARLAEQRADAERQAAARSDAMAEGGESAYAHLVRERQLYGRRNAARRRALRKQLGISNSPNV